MVVSRHFRFAQSTKKHPRRPPAPSPSSARAFGYLGLSSVAPRHRRTRGSSPVAVRHRLATGLAKCVANLGFPDLLEDRIPLADDFRLKPGFSAQPKRYLARFDKRMP